TLPPVGNPHHTVSIEIAGPAVADINEHFRQSWWTIHPDSPYQTRDAKRVSLAAKGRQSVQIVRTTEDGALPPAGEWHLDVLRNILDAISNAKKYIYIECQYFTDPLIVDGLLGSLGKNPGLNLIMIVN